MTNKQKKQSIILAVSVAELAAVYLANKFIPLPGLVQLAMYLIPYITIGWGVLKKAVVNIFHGQMLDENFLMAIATVGAIVLGDYPEAVFVMIFYKVGELFESIAVGKSRNSISSLMDIRPDVATVIRDGKEVTVSPDEVEVGEITVIKPGEKVPLDGVIVKGSTQLNTVALTGESLPRDAEIGDRAISGCINMSGVIEVKADKPFAESTVSKILELVENSSSVKSKSENFITRFSKYYTPAVVALAVLIAVVPPLFNGEWTAWINKGLMMLVVSCPCALVLSVPLAFFGGIGGASRAGILVKGSEYLERLAKADCIVFDKTGTLTKGVFKVTKISGSDEALVLGAAAESHSTHPIALSLKSACKEEVPTAENIHEHSGMGVEAYVGGERVLAGNKKLMDKFGIEPIQADDDGTLVYVAKGEKCIGVITIGDEIKEHSPAAIAELKKEGIDEAVMLTGDSEAVASHVAKELGLDSYKSQLLPQDKVTSLEEIIKSHSVTAYVGDGINDAPVLARADVGISMGAFGSDAAIEASDIVLMNDDISQIPVAMRIAKRTRRIVTENITFSLAVKFAVLVLCIINLSTMGMAIFADVGVLVLAVLNAMRGLRKA